MKERFLLGATVCAFMLVSCAKEKSYEEVKKTETLLSKGSFNTNDEMLFVASSQGVPRFTKAMAPFVQGREKVIKFKYEKEGIVAYRMEDNTEFQNNPLNNRPIFKIPGKYTSFRCKENSNNECTNKEEEVKDADVTWEEHSHFDPDFSGLEVLESDTIGLPDSGNCYTESSTKVISADVSKELVNIEVEKTYRFLSSLSCLMEVYKSSNTWEDFYDNLDDSDVFSARVFYSFAKLSNVASKDYTPKKYAVKDHSKFGFFKVSKKFKNSTRQKEREYFVKRWNPNKKEITFHLSDEFDRASNLYLKDATVKAFERMNLALSKNKVNLKLNLKMPSGKKAGDLRNSMIVLIEDIATNLLGYGPSVANPKTGEIVQAHTNMYKGSLEKFAPYSYDGLRNFEAQERASSVNTNSSFKVPNVAFQLAEQKEEATSKDVSKNEDVESSKVIAGNEGHLHHEHDGHDHHYHEFGKQHLMALKRVTQGKTKIDFEKKLLQRAKGMSEEQISKISSNHKMQEFLHKNNFYTAEMMNFEALGKVSVSQVNEVKGVRDADGVLKAWIDLTEDQKEKLIKIFVTHSYIPTLIHEIGHNLGLRHNFKGSFDKNNFYTDKEAKDLGMKKAPAYSSIMDYAYSDLNELSNFGKYDIAALKFAYNNEVSKAKFEFCTDENAGSSITCNRFDEGTSTAEIARHVVDSYENSYERRNFRGRKQRLNEEDAFPYLLRVYRGLSKMRSVHENWQGIYDYLKKFQGGEDIAFYGCSAALKKANANFCEFVDDLVLANDIVSRALIDVVKTPEKSCDVLETVTFNDQVVAAHSRFVSLEDAIGGVEIERKLNPGNFYRPTDCFHRAYNKEFPISEKTKSIVQQIVTSCAGEDQSKKGECENAVGVESKVIGQTGKFLNDVSKATRDERDSVGDLEIRGNWADKVLAMNFLTNNKTMTSLSPDSFSSIGTHPNYKEEIQNLVEHLTSNVPLLGSPVARTKQGVAYIPSSKIQLRGNINPGRMSYFYRFFFPLSSSSNVSLGKTLLKESFNSTLVKSDDFDSLEQRISASKFNKSISAVDGTKDSHRHQIIDSVTIFDQVIGYTTANTYAKSLIEKIKSNGSSITDKVMESLKTIESDKEKKALVKQAIGELTTYGEHYTDITLVVGAYRKLLMNETSEITAKKLLQEVKKVSPFFSIQRVNNAIGIYQMHNKDSSNTTLAELKKEKVSDLEFFLASSDERKVIAKSWEDTLVSLPKR